MAERVRRISQPDIFALLKPVTKRGGKFCQRAGHTVIRPARHNNALPAGNLSCDTQRQIVGFAAGAGHGQVAQLRRKLGQEIFSKFDNRIIQITRVCIELRGLRGDGFNHRRMAMTDRRNIIVSIQIAPSFAVI